MTVIRSIFVFFLHFELVKVITGPCHGLVCKAQAVTFANQLRDGLYNLLNSSTKMEELKNTLLTTDIVKFEDLDGGQLLKDSNIKLMKILKSKTDAVDNIADFVRRKYPMRPKGTTAPQCSYLLAKDEDLVNKINLTYYKSFNTAVNLSRTVIHFPLDVYEFSPEVKSAVYLTEGLDQVFIKNYQNDQFIFGQYFGSTSGLLRYYPAFFWDTANETDLYDCRYRPWYIEAAGQPRDVVFLMDTSGSMYGWSLTVAKYTAKKLLSVISDKDHVAFYTYKENCSSISCFEYLERARLKYVEYLYEQVDQIQAGGPSNFSIAVEKAFDVLDDSKRMGKSCGCQQAIIIFSDNCRNDPIYTEIFNRRNAKGKVKVFTLAFGAPNQWNTEGLLDIACQNQGFFSKVYGYGDVVTAISNMFNVFGAPLSLNANKIEASWSTVYYEYDRQNFVLTVGKSVVLDYSATNSEPFLGVAALDVDIPQMKEIMTGMFSGVMYAFMINNNGVIVVHPRLIPIDGYAGTPDMDLNELETTETPVDIIDITGEMLNRVTGSRRVSSLIAFPDTKRGRESFQSCEIYYTSMTGYPFSIAIVVPPSERQVLVVDEEALDKTVIRGAIERDVPTRMRWKKWPLCTLNITDTIKKMRDVEKVKSDPCYPYKYNTMAAEIQLTEDLALFWRTDEFKTFADKNNILNAYMVTNAGITRTFRDMIDDSTVIDPMEMQPFRHARVGIPANTILVSLPLIDYTGRLTYNITYSIGLEQGNDTFEPIVLGIQVQIKYFNRLVRTIFRESLETITLSILDENAFIVYSNEEDYNPAKVNRYFDWASEISNFILTKTKYYNRKGLNDCQQLCETEPHGPESSTPSLRPFLVNLLHTVWRYVVLFIMWCQTVDAKHITNEKTMCCEKYDMFSRNFSQTASTEGFVDCSGCFKNITVTPVTGTNLLFLIDNNPDCLCTKTKVKKIKYVKDICKGKISLWPSDLSEQSCFEDANSTGISHGACTVPE